MALKLLPPSPFLRSKTPFLPSPLALSLSPHTKSLPTHSTATKVAASLIETPVLWAGKLCVQYILIKAGLAGSEANPLIASELGGGLDDVDKEARERRKLVSKWHPTTKGTLRRNYRVPSKAQGQKVLKAIATLLSEDDHFLDAASHKGCRIRRESAHGESVCCNNVRALFDELPTPHLVVEITAFPAGPLSENDYVKAEKLERVLRSGSSSI
ncbi:hypothetical protein LUZ63_006106 [Rhynchospora breviuscula]|uniref:Uncharacterized protein n=1 Tax=Rhynchospora breviuscula TaxID=2022672 RepID=A0A9Q0CQA6_9POAL|nr:hypothetical protein LUZ63_006106 [Rhynchospora breviuscula]